MTLTLENVQTLAGDAARSVLGTDVEPCAPIAFLPGPTVTGCVNISGDWDGAVSIACSRDLSVRIAETMFGIDAEALEPLDVNDAVGEFVNIVGGGLKSLLPGTSALSIPIVIDDGGMTFPGAALILTQTVSVLGEPLVVAVYERCNTEMQAVKGATP